MAASADLKKKENNDSYLIFTPTNVRCDSNEDDVLIPG